MSYDKMIAGCTRRGIDPPALTIIFGVFSLTRIRLVQMSSVPLRGVPRELSLYWPTDSHYNLQMITNAHIKCKNAHTVKPAY